MRCGCLCAHSIAPFPGSVAERIHAFRNSGGPDLGVATLCHRQSAWRVSLAHTLATSCHPKLWSGATTTPFAGAKSNGVVCEVLAVVNKLTMGEMEHIPLPLIVGVVGVVLATPSDRGLQNGGNVVSDSVCAKISGSGSRDISPPVVGMKYKTNGVFARRVN